ncbi:MAG TPA: HlyD family efflux transporter periplasmic adaptor subunit [Smithellaceae bacterium]|nr:HlyD family efflux transporter periplasmic adaptor subunit [Smithellaceae bacterium]
MNSSSDGQLIGLTILLQISRRVREATRPEEIGFIAVNESKQLLDYRQSVLWMANQGIFAVSGIPQPDHNAPYIQWLNAAFKEWQKKDGLRRIDPQELPPAIFASWNEWLPAHGVIAPLLTKKGETLGMLFLAREAAWQDHDLEILKELVAIYAHGLTTVNPPRSFTRWMKQHFLQSKARYAIAILIAVTLFLPVRMSVQAPAEVVPKDPFVIRSPLDGVIEHFHVYPNAVVKKDDVLFSFDQTNLRARLGVAGKAFQVAEEEYRQAAQMALQDEKSRTEVAPRHGKMQEKATEYSYSRELFHRLTVRAPRPGIAVFMEQSDWIGKYVAVGEKVLVIADPKHVEILIYLPVADAIELSIGTPVSLYLAMDAQHPLPAKLRYAAYKPEVTPAGFVAYRIKADFDEGVNPPRIGLTGTARIYGEKVFLVYYILRRPLTAIQQMLGW